MTNPAFGPILGEEAVAVLRHAPMVLEYNYGKNPKLLRVEASQTKYRIVYNYPSIDTTAKEYIFDLYQSVFWISVKEHLLRQYNALDGPVKVDPNSRCARNTLSPGNIVSTEGGVRFVIAHDTVYEAFIVRKPCYPVPITEAWLLRLGLEVAESWKFETGYTVYALPKTDDRWLGILVNNQTPDLFYLAVWRYNPLGEEWQWEAPEEKPLIGIHQVQNIWSSVLGVYLSFY